MFGMVEWRKKGKKKNEREKSNRRSHPWAEEMLFQREEKKWERMKKLKKK